MNVKPKLPDYVKVIDATPEPVKGNTTRSYGYSIVHNTPVDVMMWMDETRLVVVYNIHMKVWDIASGVLLDHGKIFEFMASPNLTLMLIIAVRTENSFAVQPGQQLQTFNESVVVVPKLSCTHIDVIVSVSTQIPSRPNRSS